MPVGLMLRSMDSAELSEWLAYYVLEAEENKRAQQEARVSARAQAPRGSHKWHR